MKSRSFLLFSVLIFLLLSPLVTQAHEPDHTYLYLRIYKDAMGGRVEISAADINKALDVNINEEIEENEVTPLFPLIQRMLKEKMTFGAGKEHYLLSFTKTEVMKLDDEDDFVAFHFEMENVAEVPDALDIVYSPFFEKSPDHKGMLIVEYNWKAGIINNYSNIADVFTNGRQSLQLSLKDRSLWTGFWAMIKLGIWHIWIGLDHILFLVALVLPAVVRRFSRKDDLEVIAYDAQDRFSSDLGYVAKFKPAVLYILKIVTFFTIAHSITLAIASLGVFQIPSRYVESIIALSIALAAFHNIKPIFNYKEWLIAFAFGLFHGFGFASVLGEKGLGGDYMILSLLGFNGGVEIGQVVIILIVFPILYLIRTSKFYPKFMVYGSALLIIISLHWTIERFFEVNLPFGRWLMSILG